MTDSDETTRTKLQRIARRARQAFLEGAEEEWLRSTGRPLTPDEQNAVLEHYPGDWFEPAGPKARAQRRSGCVSRAI